MNFTPFGGPFPGTIPGIHQFTATGALASTAQTIQDTSIRYHSSTVNMTHFNQALTTAPIPKFRPEELVNPQNKYNGHSQQNTVGIQQTQQQQQQQQQQQYTTATTVPYSQQQMTDDKRAIAASINYPQSSLASSSNAAVIAAASGGHSIQTQPQEISQDLCNAILQQQNSVDTKRVLQNPSWQTLTPSSTVADYLSHLPASTLPLSLHHFLKYSAENIKKETQNPVSTIEIPQIHGQTIQLGGITLTSHQQPQQQQQQQNQHHQSQNNVVHQQNQQSNCVDTANIVTTNTTTTTSTKSSTKKKKRKKQLKEKKPKPRPGEIRMRTALDGSLLYSCPECQMCYPERGLLEVHLVGHNLERRFICEICNAALKRKDHLTRHKQSHNPERPFICSVCLKAFKRKEQLSLHFVIHSGEKRHICQECGKGFYRKDHLRKHTRSHIARRVKAELSLQNQPAPAAALQVQQQTVQPVSQQPQIPLQMQQQQMQQQQHHNNSQANTQQHQQIMS